MNGLREISHIKSKNFSLLVLLLILSLALALRLYGAVGHLPSLVDNRIFSYNLDEDLLTFIALRSTKQGYDPGLYFYPSLFFSLQAVGLQTASSLGFVDLGIFENFYDVSRLLALAGAPGAEEQIFQLSQDWPELVLVGRLIVAITGALTVLVVYKIGKEIYDKKTGLVAAFLLAILPLHVIFSHGIYVDVPQTFFMMVSFFYSIKIAKEGKRSHYVLASTFAGLAASTKWEGVIAFMPIVFAHYLKNKEPFDNYLRKRRILPIIKSSKILIGCIGVSVLAFAATSPYVMLNFHDLLRGASYQVIHVYGGHYGYDLEPDGWVYNKYVYQIFAAFPAFLGLPLYVFSILGVLCIMKSHKNLEFLLLFFFILYFLPIGYREAVFLKYLTPLTPILAIFAAVFITSLYRAVGRSKFKKVIALAASSFVILYTLAYATSFFNDIGIIEESARWINNNIPEGSTVACTPGPPPFDDTKYKFISLGYFPNPYVIETENIDYIILFEEVYKKAYRDPKRYENIYGPFEKIRNGPRYKLIKKFETTVLNEGFYSYLDPMLPFPFDVEVYKRVDN